MHTIVPPVAAAMDIEDTTDAPVVPEALIALHNRTVDAAKGYATMVEKAEPTFRDTAERFRALHARHAFDLSRLLSDRGIEPDGDGTFMGTINRAVVTVRAFFDEIDEDVMKQVRDGEDWLLQAFDEAIEEQRNAPAVAPLRQMRDELVALLDDTRQVG
jgi:uncharacterized protein (TIGR02284 family)